MARPMSNSGLYLALAKRRELPPEVRDAYQAAKKLHIQRREEARAAEKAKRRRSHVQKRGPVVELSPAAPPLDGPTVGRANQESVRANPNDGAHQPR